MTVNSVFSHLKHFVFHFRNMYLYTHGSRGALESVWWGRPKNGGRSQGSPSSLLSTSKKENYPIHFLHEPYNYLKGKEENKIMFPFPYNCYKTHQKIWKQSQYIFKLGERKISFNNFKLFASESQKQDHGKRTVTTHKLQNKVEQPKIHNQAYSRQGINWPTLE